MKKSRSTSCACVQYGSCHHLLTWVSPVESGFEDRPLLLHEVAVQEVLGDGGEGEHVDAVDVLDVVPEPFNNNKITKKSRKEGRPTRHDTARRKETRNKTRLFLSYKTKTLLLPQRTDQKKVKATT